MPISDVIHVLKEAHERGFSIIPVNRDKRPRVAWKVYQERPASPEELNEWWTQRPDAWAVVTGKVSGVIVLDFDGEAGLTTMARLGLRPHVKTGSGGAHVYLRYPGWSVQTVNGRSKQLLGEKYPGLDMRGDGGYAIFAGSNENGAYEWVRGMEPDSLQLLSRELREFLGLIGPNENRSVAAANLVGRALELVKSGSGRNDAGFWLATQLRDNGYSESEAIESVTAYRLEVPALNGKGLIQPYTAEEAIESVRQAFRRPQRAPWAQNGRRNGGNHHPPVDVVAVESNSQLPNIVVNDRELRDVTQDCIRALQAGNDPPSLYVRTGQIVFVACDEQGRHSVKEASEPYLRGRMTRSANFCRLWKSRDGSTRQFPTNPPLDAVRDLQALTAEEWQFPPLESVTESPILRPDGTVLATAGYDAMTRVVYAPSSDLKLPAIPDDPISDEVLEAVSLVNEAIEGFPFVDQSSRANAFAVLVTPIVRRAVKGNVPIALIDAPEAGTGKSLMAELVAIIHTGADAAMKPAPSHDDEEWRKTLSAVLMSGTVLTIFDNVTYRLDCGSLALAVTASTWTDRLLGQSLTITVPQRTTWIVTGNNLLLGGDLPRRCYWIRLDARTPQPWQRDGFKIPDLKKWVREKRGDLLAALLIMCRAWFSVGCPESKTPVLGSFEGRSKIVGGIVQYAGIEGFLGNLESLYEQSDPSKLQWESFLTSISEEYEDRPFTIHELVDLMRSGNEIKKALPDDLPDDDRPGNGFQRKMANAFRQRLERRYGRDGFHLVKAGEARTRVALWSVRRQTSQPEA